MRRFEEEKQVKKIALLRRTEEEETVRILSEKYKLPYLNLGTAPINTDALRIISEDEARRAEVAIFQKTGKRLDVAVRNPEKPETLSLLKKLAEGSFVSSVYLVSKTSLERGWEFYKQIAGEAGAITGQIQISDARLEEFQKRLFKLQDITRLLEEVGTRRTTDVLEVIIAGALRTEASDVHFEPQADKVRIRFRLDGVLHDITSLTPSVYKFLLSRLKLISELKLNIVTKGQDGRFTIKASGVDMEVRASTLPGPYGENVVLRVLNPKTISLELENLGMQPWTREAVERELKKPNGMILTTGPTGSGKTTTLYAFLKKTHKPGIKIITLEDPIEYHLTGIEQTQVEPERGYDFSSGLRSILRQDPDVILIGEIRDLETAETAMHAALTGHLVFSTLHTNNAAGTIPRLLDIGVKPAIITPAINMTMAQRLLRRLCARCKTKKTASPKEREVIAKEVASFPSNIQKPDTRKLLLWKGSGCEDCNFTGYKGRVGVFEVILVDDNIEALVFKNPSEATIRRAAFEQGQITMRQDGILKVIEGLTDMAEVERVIGEETTDKPPSSSS